MAGVGQGASLAFEGMVTTGSVQGDDRTTLRSESLQVNFVLCYVIELSGVTSKILHPVGINYIIFIF